jgi:hypothetical protein
MQRRSFQKAGSRVAAALTLPGALASQSFASQTAKGGPVQQAPGAGTLVWLLHGGIFGHHILVESEARLGRALLGAVVDLSESEALGVAGTPLEVIQQAPDEVAFHRNALGGGALQLREVVAEGT